MKKTLSLIYFLLIPFILFGQIDRSGNLSSETWSQNVHITADATIGDGVTIIISSGVTIELYPGVSLNIIGSGTLLADASSGTAITFTAYDGTSWGHLYFNNTSASVNSELINCIIEKGDAVGLSPAYGGGLSINTNLIDVENCIIRNNVADIGGGIHIGIGFGPVIKNCIIASNTATYGGGGIHSYAGTTTEFINCVIFNNTVPQATNLYGGGGILIGYNGNSVKIINCTFANNSCPSGADINLFGSNSFPKIINSILWSPSPIMYSGSQDFNANDFTNCAIRSSNASSYTNCIEISGTNDAPTGPNFFATDGSDWAIKVFSPCRDAGTSTGAPSTDYLGNPRIGPYDIGAYEVQYSIWKTNAATTDWGTSSNWDGLAPSSAQAIYIPSGATNYPTGSPAPDFTIGNGKELTLAPGAEATFGTLINSGSLKLESDATTVSSLIFTNFSGNDITYDLYLTGGNPGVKLYKWHYISSPVTSLSATAFTFKTNNLAQFIESRPSLGLIEGWVAYDGYVYSTGLSGGPTFYTLAPGQGYDYYYTSDWKYTFSGQPNSGSTPTSVTLYYSGTDDNLYGYNLVGNPYSSGIDWDYITANGYPANTSMALYLTSNNASIVYSNGVSTPDGYATGIIPPMQGFFIKTYQNNTTFTIPLAARTNSNIHSRYKGAAKGSGAIPLVRLSTTENGATDETVVRFDELAKTGLDYDFDATKLFVSETSTQIYSSMSGVNYAINGQPLPDSSVEIPIVVNLLSIGTHSISATQIQNLDKYSVKLKDTYTGITTDLKTTPTVSFSTGKGTLSDRYILIISDITTGVQDNPVMTGKPFNVYPAFNFINIQTLADEWDGKTGSVNVFDMTGRSILERNNIEFNKNSVASVPSPVSGGLYLVEIRSGIKRYVGKIIIK